MKMKSNGVISGDNMKKNSKAKRIIKITALSFLIILLLSVITAGIILSGRVATALSLKQVTEQLYTVNYQQEYNLDKALTAEIKSEKELYKFISDEIFFGYQLDSNISEFYCSAFLTETQDGEKLVGRNFDFDNTETLSVYTHPRNGYASVASVDIDVMAIGKPNVTDPMSIEGRLAMLAAPYVCVDGMNEKGLSIALLDLNETKLHQDTGKPSIMIPVAVRMLLDRAADVDEAIKLLSQYDMHTTQGCRQHMFLADKSGRAVVVEWAKSNMKVTESDVCTNFNLSRAGNDYTGKCDRFDTITERLKNSPQNSPKEAMNILQSASVSNTQWSCVYNLDEFSVDYVIDNKFDKTYHLTKEEY